MKNIIKTFPANLFLFLGLLDSIIGVYFTVKLNELFMKGVDGLENFFTFLVVAPLYGITVIAMYIIAIISLVLFFNLRKVKSEEIFSREVSAMKKVFIIFSILFVVLISTINIFFLAVNIELHQQKKETQFQKESISNLSTSVAPDSRQEVQMVFSAPEDWKTHVNNNRGFKFKYPKDWIVDDRYNIKILSPEWQKAIEDGKNSEYAGYYKDNACAYCYNILISSKVVSETLDEYIVKNQGGFSENPKKIKFAGEDGYEIIEAGELTTQGILFKKNNYLYHITIVQNTEIENQIISTFKFL